MEKNTILNDEEVEEGLILTCQAHPTTSVIKIDKSSSVCSPTIFP